MDILLRFCCILSIYCRYLAHQIHSWSFHERSSLAGKEWWTFQQPRGLYGNKNRKTTSLISLIVLNHSELSLVTADSMTIVEHSYKKNYGLLTAHSLKILEKSYEKSMATAPHEQLARREVAISSVADVVPTVVATKAIAAAWDGKGRHWKLQIWRKSMVNLW